MRIRLLLFFLKRAVVPIFIPLLRWSPVKLALYSFKGFQPPHAEVLCALVWHLHQRHWSFAFRGVDKITATAETGGDDIGVVELLRDFGC